MITICKMCTKQNRCYCSEKAQSWQSLVSKPECLDFEQNESTKLHNLYFKENNHMT